MKLTSRNLIKIGFIANVLAMISVTSVFAEPHISSAVPNTPPASVVPHITPASEMKAEIISVQPNYVTKKVPYTRCHYEQRAFAYQSQRAVDGSGTVIGGLAGGVIGNRFGHGNGNVAATIGGTIVGALVGNQMEREVNRPEVYYRTVEICRTHYTTKQTINGYHVTYQYNGQTQTKFMKKKPVGNELKLSLTPVA